MILDLLIGLTILIIIIAAFAWVYQKWKGVTGGQGFLGLMNPMNWFGSGGLFGSGLFGAGGEAVNSIIGDIGNIF